MSDPTESTLLTLGAAFQKKTTAFLTLGVLLMISSMYINSLKTGVGDYGFYSSIVIIFFPLLFQIISWIKYYKLFPK